MKLEKIITLANKKSEIRFLAMVRSLRATGCDLPVWVIPFDDGRFDLPDHCQWWELDEVTRLLEKHKAHPTKRKYQCFLTANYQFVDADIVFLKDPETELAGHEGFVTSCCHWNNTEHIYTEVSLRYYKEKSTTWQKSVFNAGQFACDTALYDFDTLRNTLENPLYKECFDFNYHDQLAINFLIFLSGVAVTNITLPPFNVESTWAGDYPDEKYRHYWSNPGKKPYLIHWAGCKMDTGRPIDRLFLDQLTAAEQLEWNDKLYKKEIPYKPSLMRRIWRRLK
jgi:hypothetical protein